MRQWLVLLMLLAGLASGGEVSPQTTGPARTDEPDARLMQAELLEVSSGELDKAIGIYQELMEGKETPEPVRARALLYLARCHRKRGELERAKKLLEALIANHAGERDEVRRARNYLRELRQGSSANPKFDWLGELQRNPEVQARVFDYIMDLVEPGETAERAGKQLLALGTLALPTLEQMIENSRDAAHRRRLGLILLNMGRYEHVETAMPPDYYYWGTYEPLLDNFIKSIPLLAAAEKKMLKEALLEHPEAGSKAGIRNICLLYLGERNDVAGLLAGFEGRKITVRTSINASGSRTTKYPAYRTRTVSSYQGTKLLQLLSEEKEVRKVMAGRILDPSCEVKETYLGMVSVKEPQLLDARHYVAVIENFAKNARNTGHYIQELEKRNGLKRLLDCRDAQAVLKRVRDCFASIYNTENRADSDKAGLDQAHPDWALLLRADGDVRALQYLFSFARANDGALKPLVAWLRSEQFTGDHLRFYDFKYDAWRPSPAYIDAMMALLDGGNDPARFIALHGIGAAKAGDGPAVIKKLEDMITREQDPSLKKYAIFTLIRRLGERPETGPEVARILLAHFKDASNLYPSNNRKYSVTKQVQISVHIPEADGMDARDVTFYGTINPDIVHALHGHLLKQAETEEAQALYRFFYHKFMGVKWIEWLTEDLFEKGLVKRDKVRRFAVQELCNSDNVRLWKEYIGKEGVHEGVEQLMKAVATGAEGGFPVEIRMQAVNMFWEMEGHDAVEWFNCPELVLGEDPLAPWLFHKYLYDVLGSNEAPPVEEYDRYLKAGLKSGWPEIRTKTVIHLLNSQYVKKRMTEKLPGLAKAAVESEFEDCRYAALRNSLLFNAIEEPIALLDGLVDDESSLVQGKAVERLLDIKDVRVASILIRLLKDAGKRPHWMRIINAMRSFATPDSIEAMIERVNDRDVRIQNAALGALKELRMKLAEKKEWERVLEQLRSRPDGHDKEESVEKKQG